MYVLRPAQADDFAAIRALIRQARINPTGLDWRRFVVVIDPSSGRLAACAQIKPHRGGSRELASVAVRPEYRGQGLARQVIQHLLERTSPPVYLTCRSDLRPFYEKFGFGVTPPAEMPPYFLRIWRLFNGVARLFRLNRRLLVMDWQKFP